jgi:cell division septum initiation protein DivIVA
MGMSSGEREDRLSGSSAGEREATSFGMPPLRIRGYDVAATDALIEQLIEDRRELDDECAALRHQLSGMESELVRVREREQFVSKALTAATSRASAIKDSARREAETILSKARAESEWRMERAGLMEHKREEAERELERLLQLQHAVRAGLTSFLTEAVAQLRSNGESNGATSVVHGAHSADQVHVDSGPITDIPTAG